MSASFFFFPQEFSSFSRYNREIVAEIVAEIVVLIQEYPTYKVGFLTFMPQFFLTVILVLMSSFRLNMTTGSLATFEKRKSESHSIT